MDEPVPEGTIWISKEKTPKRTKAQVEKVFSAVFGVDCPEWENTGKYGLIIRGECVRPDGGREKVVLLLYPSTGTYVFQGPHVVSGRHYERFKREWFSIFGGSNALE